MPHYPTYNGLPYAERRTATNYFVQADRAWADAEELDVMAAMWQAAGGEVTTPSDRVTAAWRDHARRDREARHAITIHTTRRQMRRHAELLRRHAAGEFTRKVGDPVTWPRTAVTPPDTNPRRPRVWTAGLQEHLNREGRQ